MEKTNPWKGSGPPEKAVPPDKTARPWLPRKNKAKGRVNVGKSHYAGTNEENPRLNIQDKSRKHLAVDHQEDIPYRERPVSGVVLPLPRPRSNLCSHQGADTRFSREEAIQKSPNWTMETAMQTAMQKELAAISQKMMDTLRKAQEETNSIMRREMQHIKSKINSVEHKQESDVKEMKDSIQEVKQG